jgi:hypothetical protein
VHPLDDFQAAQESLEFVFNDHQIDAFRIERSMEVISARDRPWRNSLGIEPLADVACSVKVCKQKNCYRSSIHRLSLLNESQESHFTSIGRQSVPRQLNRDDGGPP